MAAGEPFATPGERRGLGVPAAGGLLEPRDDLVGRLGVLVLEGTSLEDPLERLGHVEPTAAQWGIEHHDALADVLMRLPCRMGLRRPTGAGIRHGLKGTSLVLTQ